MLAKLLRSWFAQSPRSRPRSQTPTLEALETRLTPSSTPLHVAGGRLVDASGAAVVLRGVNIAGLESYPTGLDWDANSNSILPQVADEALNSWHANLIRLTLNQDFWFGHDEAVGLGESGDGGAAYQGLVQQIVSEAQASGAYVMLSVWASDMGHATTTNPVAQHDMPDDNTTLFWQSVAARYANNSTVLFDPFNEPHDVTASQWLNGGSIMENGVTYNSPGMQGLLNTIRATGANNIVAPEGLGWATNLSGIDQGFALNDPAGNLMYQFHLYPDDGQSSAAWQADVQPVLNGRYPIYIGEWGTDSDGTDGAGQPSAAAWTQNMLTWLSQNQFSWTAWEFNPPQDGGPNLISDSNYTPTDYFGAYVQTALASNTQPGTVATVTSLQASDANPTAGETVTFTATVAPQQTSYPGTPSGMVQFFDGTTYLGEVALEPANLTVVGANWATATMSEVLDAGPHTITASYEGGGQAENGATYGPSQASITVTARFSGQTAAPVVAQIPGAGIWRFESATGWQQLTPADPAQMASNDSGDVVAEFTGYGVWRYEDAGGWKQLTPVDVAQTALDAAGDVAVTVPGFGVYRFTDAVGWMQLTPVAPTQMVMDAAGDVAAEIPGYGVWRYENATGWVQLTTTDAAQLSIAGAGVVAVDIQGAGVWRFKNATGWEQLTSTDAADLALNADGDVAITVAVAGVWRFQSTSGWAQLTTADATQATIDAAGDVTVEVPTFGVWSFYDAVGWAQLTTADASNIDA